MIKHNWVSSKKYKFLYNYDILMISDTILLSYYNCYFDFIVIGNVNFTSFKFKNPLERSMI
jgi:predicted MPP superfamily phosphohydrolase